MNTVAEVEAALTRVPASPTDADIAYRADLVKRRYELLKAEQAVAATEAMKRERENWPFIVNVPDGVDAPCMSTRDGSRNLYAEVLDGKLVIRMPDLGCLKSLCISDARWYDANPHLWDTLAQIRAW